MEVETQSALTSFHLPHNGSSPSPPDVLHPENPANTLTFHPRSPGTIVPNRIFVGGIDYRVDERELRQIFSHYGAVKEVKVVFDQSGISKGYGFVTFENQEDVLKILSNGSGICFKNKKLCIGQAVKKQHTSGQNKIAHMMSYDPATPHQMNCGPFFLTTPTGYPYTYHNGVAYFHCSKMNPLAHHWAPAPQLMLSQSHQPVHHHHQPVYHQYQSISNQHLWNTGQVPVSSGAVMYSQQSEYFYQPAADGGSFPPPAPVLEDALPEFLEPAVPHVYPGRAPVLQHNPAKNRMFPSRVHLKPRHRRYMHSKNYYHPPEFTQSPDASFTHPFQQHM